MRLRRLFAFTLALSAQVKTIPLPFRSRVRIAVFTEMTAVELLGVCDEDCYSFSYPALLVVFDGFVGVAFAVGVFVAA